MPMFFLYTFLVLSFLVSSVSQTFCAAKEERKGATLDFESFSRLYLSLSQGPGAIGLSSGSSSSSQKPEVAETILSLMPLVRAQVRFMKGFQSLASAKDADSVGYMKTLRGLIGDKITNDVLRQDAQITARFSDFLCQSLEEVLRIHAQVKNKTGAACVGVMDRCLGDLWQEINTASNQVAADIMRSLVMGWQVKDPRWNIGLSNTVGYPGHLITGAVQKKMDLLTLFGEDKREFGQLASDAGQAEFYALCGDNVMAVQYFEELMFYQKINAGLSACMEKPPVASMDKSSNGEELLMSLLSVLGGASDLGLLGGQAPSLSAGHRFVIDQIKQQALRGVVLPNTSFIEGLLNPLVEFVGQETLQIKAERTAQKKKEKNRKKRERRKLKEASKKAEQESSGAAALVSSAVIDERSSKEEESDLAAALVSSAVIDEEDEDSDEDKEAGFDLAAALHSQKEQKNSMVPTVADMGGAASGVASKEISFPRSKFSEVVLGHGRGTVNASDFMEFLTHVGGKIEKPRPNGMTYYTLPNVNGTGKVRHHVHLPHATTEPFYPAILNHFIRPSVAEAGFTAEMFGRCFSG